MQSPTSIRRRSADLSLAHNLYTMVELDTGRARQAMLRACATYYMARALARASHPRATEIFRRAVEGGFHSYTLFTRDTWLDPLRGQPEFEDVIDVARRQYLDAVDAFVAAGGERLLGLPRRSP